MILKVVNGKVELRKDNGLLVRTIAQRNAVSADLNDDESMVVVTLTDGKVELRKINGLLIRSFCQRNAVNAKFSGKDIAVELANGKIELRRENGCQASKQLTLETTIFDPLIRGHLLSNNLDFKLAFIL